MYLLSILPFGPDSTERLPLCSMWPRLRQAQLGWGSQTHDLYPHGWQVVTGPWLGTQLGLWSRGPCGSAWASSQHGNLVPKGKKQELPDLLNTWALKLQNITFSAFHCSRELQAQPWFQNRGRKLHLLVGAEHAQTEVLKAVLRA